MSVRTASPCDALTENTPYPAGQANCAIWGKTLLNRKVGTSLEFFHQIGLRNAAPPRDQNGNMIGNSTDQKGRALEFFSDSSGKGLNLPANILVGQKRKVLFGRKDDGQKDAGHRWGHGETGDNPGAERFPPLRGIPRKNLSCTLQSLESKSQLDPSRSKMTTKR